MKRRDDWLLSEHRSMKSHAAPLLVITLLILPLLYGGSYLALVVPGGRIVWAKPNTQFWMGEPFLSHYRAGRDFAPRFFWPLEQIDRMVRPGAWEVRPYYTTEEIE
jgi:hypothetical protein